MEMLISIGDRLREERERLGLNQTDFAALAEKAGVQGTTRQSQSNYEKGKQMPGAPYLAAIAIAGADVQFVLTGVRSANLKAVLAGTSAQGEGSPDGDELSPREAALVDNYRAANEDSKKALEKTSAALAQHSITGVMTGVMAMGEAAMLGRRKRKAG